MIGTERAPGLLSAVRGSPLRTGWRYVRYAVGSRHLRDILSGVETYCLFIGHARSGHSIVGALLDAHPQVVISDELDTLRYLASGFSRDQLLYGSIDVARWQAANLRRKAGRDGRVYSYHVPGQWQGRSRDLRVVGDSRAGWTTRRLSADPGLLDRVARTMAPLQLRFIHVVRNPYDNIATMMLRSGRTFDEAFRQYAGNCDAIGPLAGRIGPERLARVRHEEVIGQPEATLERLCGFLGVTIDRGYLAAAAGILYASPSRSREKIDWTGAQRDRVDELIGRHEYLAAYDL